MKKKISNNLAQLEWLFQIALLVLFFILIAHFARSTDSIDYKTDFLQRIGQIEKYYIANPVLVTSLLLLTHLIVSFFSIPACAFINLGAGYILGFWKGVGLIYAVTMLSAVLGYYSGRFLYAKNGRWLGRKLPENFKTIQNRGIIYLVLLRLSPFLPFGILNLCFGYSRIPFSAYVASTFVGVFFDVVLLNKIGSSFHDLKNITLEDYLVIGGFFITLFLLVLFKKKSPVGTYEV